MKVFLGPPGYLNIRNPIHFHKRQPHLNIRTGISYYLRDLAVWPALHIFKCRYRTTTTTTTTTTTAAATTTTLNTTTTTATTTATTTTTSTTTILLLLLLVLVLVLVLLRLLPILLLLLLLRLLRRLLRLLYSSTPSSLLPQVLPTLVVPVANDAAYRQHYIQWSTGTRRRTHTVLIDQYSCSMSSNGCSSTHLLIKLLLIYGSVFISSSLRLLPSVHVKPEAHT